MLFFKKVVVVVGSVDDVNADNNNLLVDLVLTTCAGNEEYALAKITGLCFDRVSIEDIIMDQKIINVVVVVVGIVDFMAILFFKEKYGYWERGDEETKRGLEI